MVRDYLRAQNMEQLGRIEDAVELYEQSVAGGFDSSGPYDRLIFIYSERSQHAEVVRIADAALGQVRTYEDKRAWYRRMKQEAEKRSAAIPRPLPRER